MPPIKAFSEATIIKIDDIGFLLIKGKHKSINGASFCQEIRSKAFIHEIEVITEGNQK